MENFNILKGRRLRILKLLGADWNGGTPTVATVQKMNVTSIIIKMRDASQSLVSQNLAELRKAGLVAMEKSGIPGKPGKEVYYSLSDNFVELASKLPSPMNAKKDRALNKGKNRKLVVEFLRQYPDSRVKDIVPSLGRDTVSQELSILRDAGVVSFRKEKVGKFYSLIQ